MNVVFDCYDGLSEFFLDSSFRFWHFTFDFFGRVFFLGNHFEGLNRVLMYVPYFVAIRSKKS